MVALEMTESGDWLTPRYWGESFLHKPPLQYWLTALSYKFVPGTIEFQARFPSALAGLFLLGLVYWTARRLAGIAAGVAATLILLLNNQFLFEHAARSANFDALVMLLCFAGLVCGAYAHVGRWPMIASAVSISLVMLVKSPLAVFPVISVLVYQLLVNRWRALVWLGCLAVSVLVFVLPWHLYQLWKHGSAFWDTFVSYEIGGRLGTAVTAYTSRFMHVDAFWQSFLPWSPLLAAAAVATLAGWTGGSRASVRQRPILRLLAGYAALLLVSLCFVPSKWPWYGLPAYPALVVVGVVWVFGVLDTKWRLAAPLTLAALAVAYIVFFDPNPLYAPAARPSYFWPFETTMMWFAERPPGPIEWIVGIGTVVVGVALPLLRRSRRVLEIATVAVMISVFSVSARTIIAVPQGYDGTARRLAAELEGRRIEAVYLIGFLHLPWYNDRMEPLTSFYFHTLRGAKVTDCHWDIGCIPKDPPKRSALVVHAHAIAQPEAFRQLMASLPQNANQMEIWAIDPASGGGYRRIR
jgi:4-amino-4-deoxy-L-arabinose transferase-like glycosyltransferase